jgi:hypothetical protein
LTASPSPTTTAERAAQEAAEAVLYAVLDDLRNTLGMAWVDPAFRAMASDPIFLTAAWAATRPNITKSFIASAARLRRTAAEALRGPLTPPDHREELESDLSIEDVERLTKTVRALYHGAPKVYLVIQAWARLARRQRIPGTGREEVPARRGVPTWQEGVIVPGSASEESESILSEATRDLGLVSVPPALVALSPAAPYLERACREISPHAHTDEWRSAIVALRREATEGLKAFPHPMDLQWDALATRGLTEPRREELATRLTELAAAMPANVLITAYLAAALGGPEAATDA